MGAEGRRALTVVVFGIIGIILSIAEQVAYDNNYVFTAYIDQITVTLVGVQVMTIVLALLVGVIVAILVIQD